MVVPRENVLRVTMLVSTFNWLSGSTANNGTLRSNSVDTLAGPAMAHPLGLMTHRITQTG